MLTEDLARLKVDDDAVGVSFHFLTEGFQFVDDHEPKAIRGAANDVTVGILEHKCGL